MICRWSKCGLPINLTTAAATLFRARLPSWPRSDPILLRCYTRPAPGSGNVVGDLNHAATAGDGRTAKRWRMATLARAFGAGG